MPTPLTHIRIGAPGLLLGLALLAGCDFDLSNPNNPETIGENPSRGQVAAAATGLLIGARADYGDFVLDAGIIGREAYRFDGSDPRFVGELLSGPLDPGGNAFGADHWTEYYRNIRSANNLLAVIETATGLSADEQNAVKGFAHTIQALDYLMLVSGHEQDSLVIATATSAEDEPDPFSTREAVLAHIVSLLDQAQTELQAGGGAFPFALSAGFSGFETPATFLQFNRALRARTNAYRQLWDEVLTDLQGSFLNPGASLDLGVYHEFGTGGGDLANPLALNPTTSENFVHPSIRDSVEAQPGGALDRRYLAKVVERPEATVGEPPDQLRSDLGWIRYPSPSSPIPIIRNEELILLRAEANIGLGSVGPAMDDINFIRVNSGGLAPRSDVSTPAAALEELLKQRMFSLLFEGGHRWIDARRYGRLNALPIDRSVDVVHPSFLVPLQEVISRQ
jgi:hypothetical protein